jgi:CelD/BcsL family acetyltransferase involved in cellulose biosynthesis
MLAGHWQNFRTDTLNAKDAAKTLLQWQQLAAHALDPSGFNAPELMLPILKHKGGAALFVVAHGPDLLCALPCVKAGLYNSSWINPLSAGGAPHVAQGLKEATLTAFVNAQVKPFLFHALPHKGAVHNLLKQTAHHYAVLESWERAGLSIFGTYENWLQNNFDQKRRKEFKRLRNRLGEQGDLQTEILQASQDVSGFVDDFLNLEASGWKGKKGTAINADLQLSAALRDAAQALHAVGKLRFWSLKLNGKSIASLFAIVEGNQAWLGKIAYDENYAKYSPGALIILDCTASFFSETAIKQVDSSAIPNHPLIDRLWRDRLQMVSAFVAPETMPKWRFNMIVRLTKTKLQLRSKIRDLYYKAKGKKRS